MPGGCVTYTAVVPKQGDARTWHAYSLAIALAPFCYSSSRPARSHPESRLSPRPGPRSVAIGQRRRAHQPAAEATSAWSLAWPAGMPSLLWANAGTDVPVPPADSADSGVIWGCKTAFPNETLPPGEMDLDLAPGPGVPATARLATCSPDRTW